MCEKKIEEKVLHLLEERIFARESFAMLSYLLSQELKEEADSVEMNPPHSSPLLPRNKIRIFSSSIFAEQASERRRNHK